MAKIQKVIYGDDQIQVVGSCNGYKLVIVSPNGTAVFDAAYREEMQEIVETISSTIRDIGYELSSPYSNSIFHGICEKPKEEQNEPV
jgi:hypothetical protein